MSARTGFLHLPPWSPITLVAVVLVVGVFAYFGYVAAKNRDS